MKKYIHTQQKNQRFLFLDVYKEFISLPQMNNRRQHGGMVPPNHAQGHDTSGHTSTVADTNPAHASVARAAIQTLGSGITHSCPS